MKRRNFIKKASVVTIAAPLAGTALLLQSKETSQIEQPIKKEARGFLDMLDDYTPIERDPYEYQIITGTKGYEFLTKELARIKRTGII